MLRECPHCEARLQPGEAYLGWCGACANCFWVKPQHGRPVPVPAAWNWVAYGALVKLVALLVGVGGLAAVANAAGWDVRAAFAAPLPAGVAVVVVAACLDVVGRLLCLATPQASIRWVIVTSVVCQLAAVPLAVGGVLAPPTSEERWALVAGAVLAQVAAAVTFTIYLLAVGVYLRSPTVMALAGLVKMAMAGTAAVVAVAVVLMVLLLILVVIGAILFFICPCVGCLILGSVSSLGEAVVGPLVVALAVVLALVELLYGSTLVAVLCQLWRRPKR
jgi:hypothetical protein